MTAYPGFEDFCDAVQAEAVKTSGEAWQAVSDECKAWLVHGPGNSCGGVYLVCLNFHRGCFHVVSILSHGHDLRLIWSTPMTSDTSIYIIYIHCTCITITCTYVYLQICYEPKMG